MSKNPLFAQHFPYIFCTDSNNDMNTRKFSVFPSYLIVHRQLGTWCKQITVSVSFQTPEFTGKGGEGVRGRQWLMQGPGAGGAGRAGFSAVGSLSWNAG